MVVNPIGRTAVVMQAGHMGAYPDPDIRHSIDTELRKTLGLIKAEPVNGAGAAAGTPVTGAQAALGPRAASALAPRGR